MSTQRRIANSIVDYALTGGDAHVATRTVFDGLDWKIAGARVDSCPHTIYQLLKHMTFWQDGVLDWLGGESPSMPAHAADSWPKAAAPNSRAEWIRAVRHFRMGLTRLEQRLGKLPQRGKDAAKARWRCWRESPRTIATMPGRRPCSVSC